MKAFLFLSCLYVAFLLIVGCATGKDLPEGYWAYVKLKRQQPTVRYGEHRGVMQVWATEDGLEFAVFAPKAGLIGQVEKILITK